MQASVGKPCDDAVQDVIKSGGEWISSIEIENAAMAHPQVWHTSTFNIFALAWPQSTFRGYVPACASYKPAPRCQGKQPGCCSTPLETVWVGPADRRQLGG